MTQKSHELFDKDKAGDGELLRKLYTTTIKQPTKYMKEDVENFATKVSLVFDSEEHFDDWLSEIKDIARREGHIEGLAAYKQKVKNFVLEILND